MGDVLSGFKSLGNVHGEKVLCHIGSVGKAGSLGVEIEFWEVDFIHIAIGGQYRLVKISVHCCSLLHINSVSPILGAFIF